MKLHKLNAESFSVNLGVVIFIHSKVKNYIIASYYKFFHESVGDKNKYKNQKAVWFEYYNK